MATGSTTVVAQESLPDMVESDSSAIAGQAYAKGRFTSRSVSLPHGREVLQKDMDTILGAKESCICWEYPEGTGWQCSPDNCNQNP